MIKNRYLAPLPIKSATLIKRMLLGAAIGLAVILFFVLNVDHPHPNWGNLWMVRPLLVVPLAGAGAGAFSYLMDGLRLKGGWKRVLANTFSVIAFFITLWLGTVLGLAGTMWN